MAFSITARLCNNYNYLIPEYFYHLKSKLKKKFSLAIILHFPSPQPHQLNVSQILVLVASHHWFCSICTLLLRWTFSHQGTFSKIAQYSFPFTYLPSLTHSNLVGFGKFQNISLNISRWTFASWNKNCFFFSFLFSHKYADPRFFDWSHFLWFPEVVY